MLQDEILSLLRSEATAYRSGEDGSRDTLVVEAGENEGIYLAPFPLDAMRAYRGEEAHGWIRDRLRPQPWLPPGRRS